MFYLVNLFLTRVHIHNSEIHGFRGWIIKYNGWQMVGARFLTAGKWSDREERKDDWNDSWGASLESETLIWIYVCIIYINLCLWYVFTRSHTYSYIDVETIIDLVLTLMNEYAYAHYPALSAERLWKQWHPGLMSKRSAQVLISVYHFKMKIKQNRHLGEMANSKTGVGEIQKQSILQYQQVRKCSKHKKMGTCQRDIGANLKEFPAAKIWNNLSNKINSIIVL